MSRVADFRNEPVLDSIGWSIYGCQTMASPLTLLDWSVIAVYVAVVGAIAWWTVRRVRDAGGFLLGQRRLGTWMMVASTFSGGINSNDPVTTASATYSKGMPGLWLGVVLIFNTPFYWMWPPVLRRLRVVTLIDVLRMRFGRVLGWGNLLLTVLAAPFAFGVGIKAAAVMIMVLSGTGADGQPAIGIHAAIAMIVLPTVAYTVLGGVVAAYAVDLFQGLLIIVLSFLLLPFAIAQGGGRAAVAAAAERANPEVWSMLGSTEVTGAWLFWLIAGSMLSATAIYGWGALGARSEMAARWSILGNLGKRICTIGWALVGIVALALFGSAAVSGVKPDEVFAATCLAVLPSGLRGVMVAAMLAAVMSTLASYMLSLGAVLVNNVYKDHLVPRASPGHYLTVSRVATGATVFLGWGVAASGMTMTDLMTFNLRVNGLIGLLLLLAVCWRRITANAAIAGLAVMIPLFLVGEGLARGAGADLYRVLAGWSLAAHDLIGVAAAPGLDLAAWDGAKPLPVQVTTPIYLVAGLLTLVAVSLATRQHDPRQVAEFYARLDTPLGQEDRLRAAGFQADTLEGFGATADAMDGATPARPEVSRRFLLIDLLAWPRLLWRGEARPGDWAVDLWGIAGSIAFILAFVGLVQAVVWWLRG
ncbi:MAG: Sodium/pantothenate symporter [Planctomycetota bacterium]|jgi:SSS family solute:Na+ symporter